MPFCGRLVGSAGDIDRSLYVALSQRAIGIRSCFLRHQGRTVISHSPECYVDVHDQRMVSDPIKGTRPRCGEQEADEAAKRELMAAAKDGAELAMIVDLVRNDLSRVAKPGTVRVAAARKIMELPYVHHQYASVVADLRSDYQLTDVLRASYPAGSITGAPKIKAMELLAAIERQPRGPYCGTVGWWATGTCAFCRYSNADC